jgi:DNA helicase-2/ATP-dependent DNA helicase PcrA
LGLNYRVIGGPRFYVRKEIRDCMAYFRTDSHPAHDLAFERIINTPKRGIGDTSVRIIHDNARARGIPLFRAALELCDSEELKPKTRSTLKKLLEDFGRWSTLIETMPHAQLAEMILDESGYTQMWQNDRAADAPGRLENLKELIVSLDGFENLQGFLEHVSLIMENEQKENLPKVTIMTLHAAKGLEFPAVFLPGWEEGVFPSQRSIEESGIKGLEEERRLAYVGITRAEEICTVSFSKNRMLYTKEFRGWHPMIASQFIDELPKEHIEVLNPPSLYTAAMSTDMADKVARADAYSSPGWKRMQARNAQYTPSSEPKPKRLIIDAEEIPDFAIGDRVAHEKYGVGTVIGVEAGKLSIVFEGGGAKKILASFVTMQDDVPF